ncbi:hypothetical protein M8J76_011783 [Diaphorina citri]|nr:hypothetical protein M8J76_011783 [Diaphorina citri]
MNLAFRNRQNRIWLLFADEMPDGTVRNVSERLDQLFEDLLRVVSSNHRIREISRDLEIHGSFDHKLIDHLTKFQHEDEELIDHATKFNKSLQSLPENESNSARIS